MINNKILMLASCLLFLSCGQHKNVNENTEMCVMTENILNVPTTNFPYKVINKSEDSIITLDNKVITKVTYVVIIPSEYSKDVLDEIADILKYEANNEYVFVEYYLESQSKTGVNYGISKRTPLEISSTINYVAPPKTESVTIKAPYDGCKVYGKWQMVGAIVIVYQKKGKCYMVNFYGGSKYSDPERYIKTTYEGCTAFKNVEDPADMYIINNNGDLDGYYDGDLASTFSRIY